MSSKSMCGNDSNMSNYFQSSNFIENQPLLSEHAMPRAVEINCGRCGKKLGMGIKYYNDSRCDECVLKKTIGEERERRREREEREERQEREERERRQRERRQRERRQRERRQRERRQREIHINNKPDCCFRDCDKVVLLTNGKENIVSADEIRVGDTVKTVSNGYSKVYYVHVPYDNALKSVILLSFKSNNSHGQIGLTPSHLLYDNYGKLKQAKTYQIGNIIQTLHGDAVITDITTEKCIGVRSIITTTSELMLNGARVSSYAGTSSFATFIHKTSGPLRLLANLSDHLGQLSNRICKVGRRKLFDKHPHLIHAENKKQIIMTLIKK
eukprot:360635_1